MYADDIMAIVPEAEAPQVVTHLLSLWKGEAFTPPTLSSLPHDPTSSRGGNTAGSKEFPGLRRDQSGSQSARTFLLNDRRERNTGEEAGNKSHILSTLKRSGNP